jgi:hypothetical protein
MIKVENIHKRFKLSRQQKREMGREFEGSSVDAVDGASSASLDGFSACSVPTAPAKPLCSG